MKTHCSAPSHPAFRPLDPAAMSDSQARPRRARSIECHRHAGSPRGSAESLARPRAAAALQRPACLRETARLVGPARRAADRLRVRVGQPRAGCHRRGAPLWTSFHALLQPVGKRGQIPDAASAAGRSTSCCSDDLRVQTTPGRRWPANARRAAAHRDSLPHRLLPDERRPAELDGRAGPSQANPDSARCRLRALPALPDRQQAVTAATGGRADRDRRHLAGGSFTIRRATSSSRWVLQSNNGAISGSVTNSALGMTVAGHLQARAEGSPVLVQRTDDGRRSRWASATPGVVDGNTIAGEITIVGGGTFPFDGTRATAAAQA